MPKTAGIILIGNEILSGKIIDANAAYLCRELRELGVEVRRVVVIPDEVSLIAEEVAAFSKAFDLVFTSGGDTRSEEHTSELQSRLHLVCRLLLEKKKQADAQSCGTTR